MLVRPLAVLRLSTEVVPGSLDLFCNCILIPFFVAAPKQIVTCFQNTIDIHIDDFFHPPWNFLYEMVGVNPQKRYHNDIGYRHVF